MEDVGTRIAEQIQWTEVALVRVGGCNQLALGGRSFSGESVVGAGLGSRLTGAPREEIGRRDHQGGGLGVDNQSFRYNSTL